MKKIFLSCVCAIALSACATGHPANQQPGGQVRAQTATDIANNVAAMPQAQVPTDPDVQTYSTTGAYPNPLVGDHANGIMSNATTGGYTLFDDSVTVYPLPGEQAPSFVPNYAVPPLKGQYDGGVAEDQKANPPGEPGRTIGMASAGNLPPVKDVEVADDNYSKRRPMTLSAPEPLSMQPPVSATTAPRSPFAHGGLTGVAEDDDMSETPTQTATATTTMAPAPSMSEGRRSSPMLTGF